MLDFIQGLLDKKVSSPKIIFDSIARESVTNPQIQKPKDARQLYNYLSILRNSVGPNKIGFDQLSEWCIEKYTLPEDINQAFVGAYQINIDGDEPEKLP